MEVAMSTKIPDDTLTKFLVKVIAIEKNYAHEFHGVKNDRRGEIRELVDRVTTEELENEA
jgi:hypothetical protein